MFSFFKFSISARDRKNRWNYGSDFDWQEQAGATAGA